MTAVILTAECAVIPAVWIWLWIEEKTSKIVKTIVESENTEPFSGLGEPAQQSELREVKKSTKTAVNASLLSVKQVYQRRRAIINSLHKQCSVDPKTLSDAQSKFKMASGQSPQGAHHNKEGMTIQRNQADNRKIQKDEAWSTLKTSSLKQDRLEQTFAGASKAMDYSDTTDDEFKLPKRTKKAKK